VCADCGIGVGRMLCVSILVLVNFRLSVDIDNPIFL
jgi:hypothetical protein